jgi:serine/threonine protein kinase
MASDEQEHETGAPAREGEPSGELEDLLSLWWSRYCPRCKTRRPLEEEVCPRDGTALRDLSFTSIGSGEITSFPNGTDCSLGTEAPSFPDDGLPRCPGSVPVTLGNKWSIVSRHGGGTFGTFYTGKHLILGKKVGIKVLRRRFTSTEAGRRHFHEEAMRVSRLDHPHIVKVFDYGEEEDRPYLVMEYLPGQPLSQYLVEGGLSLEEGVEAVRQAGVALVAAHDGMGTGEPLVHLDLKPEHIFLEKIQERWHAKVIDFGIAEIVASPSTVEMETASGKPERNRIAGTLPYMAPERWDGVVDPRCDIYSLGVILYEIAARRKPFLASDPTVMRSLHQTEDPAPPSRYRPGKKTPALGELDSIILRCLEKSPDRRFPSATALVTALEKWQSRPRLTIGQRVRRASMASALVLLLVLFILYLGPCVTLVHNVPHLASIGPEKSLEFICAAPGFQGGEVFLHLQGAKGGPCRARYSEADNAYTIGWPEIREAFQGDVPDGEREATIIMRGWLYRWVSSKPFPVFLHGKPPRISQYFGMEIDQGVLWLSGDDLAITADEPLQAGKSYLVDGAGHQIPAEPASSEKSTDDRMVRFDGRKVVQKATPGSPLAVVLCDVAGNASQCPLGKFRRNETPILGGVVVRGVLISPNEEIKTNCTKLTLKLQGKCGKIEVVDEKKDPREVALIAENEYEVKLQPGQGGVLEQRELEVRLWSELSAIKGRGPETLKRIKIEHLSRDMVVSLRSSSPHAFVLKDRQGKEVPLRQIRWTCFLYLHYPGENSQRIDGQIDPDTGLLNVPKLELKPGKITFSVEAEDAYGNKSNVLVGQFGEGPQVTEFSLSAEEGSLRKPLPHKDCPLRSNPEIPAYLTFKASLKYDLPFSLELRANDSFSKKFPGKSGLNTLSVLQSEILGSLHGGEENVFRLVATDDQNNQIASPEMTCSVYYDSPLNIEVKPPEGMQRDDDVPVQVGVKGIQLARVKEVRIGVKGGSTTARRIEKDLYETKVPLKRFGSTEVEVEVEMESGYRCRRTSTYFHAPEDRMRYRFRLREGMELELQYHQGDGRGQDLYSTRLEASSDLLKWFRKSQRGAEFYKRNEAKNLPGSGRARDGACWKEAQAILEWLTEELQQTGQNGLLPLGQKAELPRLQVLQRLPPEAGESAEWLSGDFQEDQVEGHEATFLDRSQQGATPLGANSWSEFFRFRVVLPASGNELSPRRASAARDPDGSREW